MKASAFVADVGVLVAEDLLLEVPNFGLVLGVDGLIECVEAVHAAVEFDLRS
jgi:hypothetical protein